MYVLIPITFFALIFAVFYVHLTTRNKERLAMIANGANPELFKSKSVSGSGSSYGTFKVGLFLIGIAMGIVAGYFLNQGGMDEVASYFSMIFLFGGIGLILSFLLQGKLEKK